MAVFETTQQIKSILQLLFFRHCVDHFMCIHLFDPPNNLIDTIVHFHFAHEGLEEHKTLFNV